MSGEHDVKRVRRPKWLRSMRVLPPVVLALVAAACGGDYPQSTLAPVTDFADIIQSLYVSVFWWTALILAVVWLVLGYILIRFRERPGQPEPRQIHGHLGLEIAWTVGPALIIIAIAIPTIQAVFETQAPAEEGALVVEVTGTRYWWSFRYPDEGITTANELHLPVDRQISLQLSSDDLVHSFWVPRLGGKRDVNPIVVRAGGRTPDFTWLRFRTQEEGVFTGQCAEFCGLSHALMGIQVIVESAEEFDEWVENWGTPSPTALPPPPADDSVAAAAANLREAELAQSYTAEELVLIEEGRRVFHEQSYCVLCHAIEGTNATGAIGPNLTLLGQRRTIATGMLENTAANLVDWIRAPESFKPGVGMPGATSDAQVRGQSYPATDLSEQQLLALAAYLGSLR